MFCTVVQNMHHYYDSECMKRAKTSKILAVDVSYKVQKLMMKWDSVCIYDTLHSGTNEYNEVIMQIFGTIDNHQELGSNLKILSDLGLNSYLVIGQIHRGDILLHMFMNPLQRERDADQERELQLRLP